MENEIKPGWKTSEFWVTTLGSVLLILVGFGVIGPEHSDVINETGTQLIERGFELLAVALPIFGYSLSRGLAKQNKQ